MNEGHHIRQELARLELAQRQLTIDRDRFDLQQRLTAYQNNITHSGSNAESGARLCVVSISPELGTRKNNPKFGSTSKAGEILVPQPSQNAVTSANGATTVGLNETDMHQSQSSSHEHIRSGTRSNGASSVRISVMNAGTDFQLAPPAYDMISVQGTHTAVLELRARAGLQPLRPERTLSMHPLYHHAPAHPAFDPLADVSEKPDGQARKKRRLGVDGCNDNNGVGIGVREKQGPAEYVRWKNVRWRDDVQG